MILFICEYTCGWVSW